jgi:hypothetical protein
MNTITAAVDDRLQASGKTQTYSSNQRLPCRGCTRNCANYTHCNGKPWRMQIDTVNNRTRR